MEDLNNLLKHLGFGFPENSEQLRQFNKIFKDYKFKANVQAIDAEKIVALIKKETKFSITNVDYHKRTVLAAEIVWQLKDEWTMGHVKLQKLLYLCQNAMSMPIHANFLKQAMGPYDPILMRSLDKQLEEHGWFKYTKGQPPQYKPLEKIGGHKEWFEKYYGQYIAEIQFIIETFRKTKTHNVELVATIYYCWEEIITNKEIFSENLIVHKLYKWSKEKEKFKEQEILGSIEWMKEVGIYPKSRMS